VFRVMNATLTRLGTRLGVAMSLALSLVMSLAACHGSPSPTGQGPTATGSAAPGATTPAVSPSASRTPPPTAPPTDPVVVFAADGIGGYRIGAQLSDLIATHLIISASDSPSCTDAKTADTTGVYAGKVSLTIRASKLSAIHTTSTAYVTPSGAKVGMTLATLQGLYGDRGTVITGQLGNKAYSVRVPATQLALVFFLDQTNTTVTSMSGGEAQPLEDAVRTGEGC
jgi:hypothetical protein